MIAILVDLARLATYAASFGMTQFDPAGREVLLAAAGTLAAFAGAFVATRFLHKVTIRVVRYCVAALMLAIGAALALGVLG